MHHFLTALLLPLALALPAPAEPLIHTLTARQASGSGGITDSAIAAAVANMFTGSFSAFHTSSSSASADSGSSTSSSSSSSAGTSVSFSNCAAGSDVSKVTIEPCEGGSGEEGDACVFTQGK